MAGSQRSVSFRRLELRQLSGILRSRRRRVFGETVEMVLEHDPAASEVVRLELKVGPTFPGFRFRASVRTFFFGVRFYIFGTFPFRFFGLLVACVVVILKIFLAYKPVFVTF